MIFWCALLACIGRLTLWGENIWKRLYVHQFVKTRFDRRKVPLVATGFRLSPRLLCMAKMIVARDCSLKPNTLTQMYGALQSDARGGAIYSYDLGHPRGLEDIRLEARTFAQDYLGTPLFSFRFSMWNAFVLKYTGTAGSFGWHYDSEDHEDVRVLVCVTATPTCGTLQYRDEKGEVKTLQLQEGHGYMLRGSTTFHRVTPNHADNDSRVMLGFHFTRSPEKITRNLCYLAALTGCRMDRLLYVWFTQLINCK